MGPRATESICQTDTILLGVTWQRCQEYPQYSEADAISRLLRVARVICNQAEIAPNLVLKPPSIEAYDEFILMRKQTPA